MSRPTPVAGLGPQTSLAEAARRILASRLADARRHEDALGDEPGEDAVHDLRVAIRRLRAPLKMFRDLGRLAKLEREVKRLQDALGEVRDVHVQSSWLHETARGEKPKDRAALDDLRARVERRLEGAERKLRRELRRWNEKTVPALLRELERLDGPGRLGGQVPRQHLLRRLRRVKRHMKDYERAPDALLAHELRKEVKKLRYEAELLAPALRRKMEAILEALVPLQEVLGALHDADVRLVMLGQLATGGSPTERAAARLLRERVPDERAACAARLARELERWRAEKLARGLRLMLA